MSVNHELPRLAISMVFVLCCSFALALPVQAGTSSSQERWEFGGAAYLWASGMESTSASGDEVEVSFSEVLENLDGGLMGILSAQKGRWTLIGDFIYLSLQDYISSSANIIGIPTEVNIDAELEGFVSTVGVAYRIVNDDTTSLDLLVGARYISLDLDLDLDVGLSATKYSESWNALDAIIGGQLLVDLSEKWYLSLYADIGTGDSKVTWQAWPGVGYRFRSVDAVLAYRHLEWESDGGDILDDMNFNGPMLGVKFRF